MKLENGRSSDTKGGDAIAYHPPEKRKKLPSV